MLTLEATRPFAFDAAVRTAPLEPRIPSGQDRRNLDPLTGMMSRPRMVEALGEAIIVARAETRPCAFLIAAIKNLGDVNEAYGFDVANEVIVAMGQRLRQQLKAGDALARCTGAQFGFILNNCSERDLLNVVERLLGAARDSVIETRNSPVWALLSIGAVVLPESVADAAAAIALAEESLAQARRLPSDGHVINQPSPAHNSPRQTNAHCATEIVRCLREDRFRLAFQPVVAADTGTVAFHEALLRIEDTSGEIIVAGHLIPIAEKMGLARLIDRAVLQMAVAALHRYPEARLAINISGATATDPRWHPQLTSFLAANQGVANRLITEITETVALGDLEETQHFVAALRALGTRVAIDDFGAGFTSFRTLRKLPVDFLKLDGSFCRDLADNSENRYFVRSLIDMARAFKFQTVAEWVESEADARMLREWRVDFLQGNFLGRPSLEAPWQEAPSTEAFFGEP